MSCRMRRILALALTLLLSAMLLQAQEAAAVRVLEEGAEIPAVAKLLQKGGKILLEAAAGWGVGRALDKTFPKQDDQKGAILDLKNQLERAKSDLSAQLNEARKNNLALGADLQAATAALRATQTQLDMIARLQKPVVTQTDVSSLRRELNATQFEAGSLLSYRPTASSELHRNLDSLQSHLTTQTPSEVLLPPSFDCRKAQSDVDRYICSNPLLSDADGRMGKAYWSLYTQLELYVSRSEALRLKLGQRIWIQDRDHQLITACMQGYRMNLSCALNIWRARTTYLAHQQTLLTGIPGPL